VKNGWTSGQYSVYRILLGGYLLQHFVGLLPWGSELFSSKGVLTPAAVSPLWHAFPNIFWLADSPLFVGAVLTAGALLSVCFLFGKWDRVGAVLLWYVWASLYGRNPLIGNPSMPFIGWLLLAYTITPVWPKTAAASGDEKAARWAPPGDLYLAAWIVMALGYSYSGYTKLGSISWMDGSALSRVLSNPLARDTVIRIWLLALPTWILKAATWSALALELGFAPLALFRRARPWIWSAMVALHFGLMVLINFADLTAGMLLVHLFTFDPAWVRAPQAAGEIIFFDGHCGFCHEWVRWILREDRSAYPFCFAPLQGELVQQMIAEEARAQLPDSIVIVAPQNRLLVKSDALIYILKRLGGLWFVMAFLLCALPRRLRDVGYETVAHVRRRIAGTTQNLCPMVPEMWRAQFRP
jgi:predicted DCC family thiol-disulfide oxidoreductase YuxK